MIKDLSDIMKQAGALQEKMQDMQAALEDITVEGSSAGGMVAFTVSAKGTAKGLKIDPSLVNPDETEMLEDLIIAAFNDAKAKAEARAQDETQKLMAGMPIPPGFKMPVLDAASC